MIYVDKKVTHMVAASCKGPDNSFNKRLKWLRHNGFKYNPDNQYWVRYIPKHAGIGYLESILCWPYWAAFIGPIEK